VLQNANGSVYDGNWVAGKECGHGVYTSHVDASNPEYVKYSGAHLSGHSHGHGLMEWAGGSTYKGQFVEGKRNGHGRYTSVNGSVYTGE
jgi:hypothetical protein